MPGRQIDRIVLTLLGVSCGYLLLLNLGLPIPLCCLMTFAGAFLGRHFLSKIPRKYRATPEQARAALRAIAMLPEDEARTALIALTNEENLIPALRYPASTLDAGDIYAIWQTHRDEKSLCVAATCSANAGARDAARTLGVTLIDGDALMKIIRRTGQHVPPEAPREKISSRLRRACRSLLDRPARPRAALYGVSLLVMYQLTGLPLYLVMGLGVLFFTGARWIHGAA